MAYEYQNVWKHITPELAEEITAFWIAEKALPKSAKPDARAQQVVVVMRDDGGAIAAVSSALPRVVPRLRQVLYYYRTFCGAAHRGNKTSTPMMQATQKALLEYNLGLPKPEAIGVIIEIENAMIAGHYTEAFWPQTGFSFIGYSPRGLPLRVHYFPGFKLQPPVRIAAPRARAQQPLAGARSQGPARARKPRPN